MKAKRLEVVSRYVAYNPEQDWLLPPSILDELGEDHLAAFVHRLVERLDLSSFEAESSPEGRPGYPPQLLLKVWLYAYCLGVTSSRRLEQRIREDLGFRLLAGNLKPDHWTLNEFRRRHPRRLNDVFTQVVEVARQMGLGQLGRVAIDSTRVAANASPDCSDTVEQLRRERVRIRRRVRRWQQECNRDDSDAPGTRLEQRAQWQQRLEEIPRQLEQLRKSGQKRGSRTDPESRYLRTRQGFCLGFTGEVAVADDHLIVAQRVHQRTTDHGSAAEMTEAVVQQCGERPAVIVADSSYYNIEEIRKIEAAGSQAIVPDPLLARELMGGPPAPTMNVRQQHRTPGLREHRERLRKQSACQHYRRRKALVEPIFGVLKQQRGIRQFRCRGLVGVATEWALATTAYNLTRIFTVGLKASH
ncbi:MAG TPA: IS1182 family transposase [Lacunisphaera sp.]|nr:IS1182 family transposase [Lacunisphaera sp.]